MRFPSFQQYDTSHDICALSDAPRSPASKGTPAEGLRVLAPVPVSPGTGAQGAADARPSPPLRTITKPERLSRQAGR